jgi:hypothetical protein
MEAIHPKGHIPMGHHPRCTAADLEDANANDADG